MVRPKNRSSTTARAPDSKGTRQLCAIREDEGGSQEQIQVVVQMVRMERNWNEVDDFIRFWNDVPGVDQVRIKADETNLMRPDRGHRQRSGSTRATTCGADRCTSSTTVTCIRAARATCWMPVRSAMSAGNRLMKFGTALRCSRCAGFTRRTVPGKSTSVQSAARRSRILRWSLEAYCCMAERFALFCHGLNVGVLLEATREAAEAS